MSLGYKNAHEAALGDHESPAIRAYLHGELMKPCSGGDYTSGKLPYLERPVSNPMLDITRANRYGPIGEHAPLPKLDRPHYETIDRFFIAAYNPSRN
jgi:hypothetical protein